VSGKVITGPSADGPVQTLPFPHLRVKILDVGETHTDAAGDWTIANSDATPRTCSAFLDGLYAIAFDAKSRNINFVGEATPGVHLPILLNENPEEWTTALANAYFHTTRVHDWYKEVTGHTEMDFQALVAVNINDPSFYCNRSAKIEKIANNRI